MKKPQPAIVKPPPNYEWMGFVFTTSDVKRLLDLPLLNDVDDLVRTGALSALSTTRGGKRVLLFHPDEVTAYRGRRAAEQEQVDGRLLDRAVSVVRSYLRTNQPVDDYLEAVEFSRPVRCVTRGGRPAIHVHAETIARLFNQRDEVILQKEAPVTTSMIEKALARMSGRMVKGWITLADRSTGKQRWSWWWRLPHDIASDGPPDVAPLVRDAGEPVGHTGNVTFIDTPLTSRQTDG